MVVASVSFRMRTKAQSPYCAQVFASRFPGVLVIGAHDVSGYVDMCACNLWCDLRGVEAHHADSGGMTMLVYTNCFKVKLILPCRWFRSCAHRSMTLVGVSVLVGLLAVVVLVVAVVGCRGGGWGGR